jgi:hypothetical protein
VQRPEPIKGELSQLFPEAAHTRRVPLNSAQIREPTGNEYDALSARRPRYLDCSLMPSIIVFICGCRSPIICIITGIERCITSGIF